MVLGANVSANHLTKFLAGCVSAYLLVDAASASILYLRSPALIDAKGLWTAIAISSVPIFIALLTGALLYLFARKLEVGGISDDANRILFAGIKLLGVFLLVEGGILILSSTINFVSMYSLSMENSQRYLSSSLVAL